MADKAGKLVQSLAELDGKVVAAGASAAAFGAALLTWKGTELLLSGFGLKGSAVALDGSAAALTRAAVALGAEAALDGGRGPGKAKATKSLGKTLLGFGATGAAIGAGTYLGTTIGETIVDIGEVAAGKHWQPKTEEALADLRQQRNEASARADEIQKRTHPSRRNEHNPELSVLNDRIADLDNRIASVVPKRATAEEALPSSAERAPAPGLLSFDASGPREVTPATTGTPAPDIPLPPPRPSGLDGGARKTKEVLDAIGETVSPKVDMASLDAAEVKARATEAAMALLGGTITPQVNTAALDALSAKFAELIGQARTLGKLVSSAKSQAGKLSLPSSGGADGPRTGKVARMSSGLFADA